MNLGMTAQSGAVTLDGPANANVAPPGWYMLFLLDENGVPSVSKIVQIKPAPDTTAPTAPTGLAATTQGANVNVSWTAATDNVGVTEYRVFRSTTADFTPSPSNRIGTVTSGTSYVDSAPPVGRHYYRVVAADAAGNAGPASAADDAIVPDTTPPAVTVTAPAEGATVSGTATLTATATDNVGVTQVTFTVDGTQIGAPDTTSPYSITSDTTTLSDGTHTIRAVARDAAGNTRTSDPRTVTIANTVPGLRAAYGFEETSGSTVVDRTGGNNGTISGATRSTSGRFGRALSFDGFNDRVNVAHDAAMNPGAAFTLEAWVYPTSTSGSRLVAGKERTSSSLAYGLYSRGGLSTPMARIFTSSDQSTSGPAQLPRNTWSHLAMTRGSSTMRLYVNGVEVASRAVGSALASSTGAFRIGGTTTASTWFGGRIDEVRVYDRQLSAAEITADMNAPVGP
jgi:concanavalin A-like lectin/glucanase superfamily protein/Big-like domain-containing protein/galactose oxidase-like protein